MKKIICFALICIFPLQMAFPNNQLPGKDSVFYWFNIKLGKSIDRKTKTSKLMVKKLKPEIESGYYQNFVESHRLGLKKGTAVIGPFEDKIQAQKAINYYSASKKHQKVENDSASKIESDSGFYYYLTRPVIGKLFKPLSFQRIPARISTGSQSEYLAMLEEGLSFQFLAIGPFMDYNLAEKSKFIFRKYGESENNDTLNAANYASIETMTKKWKSLKVEMIKLSKKKSKDKVYYQLRIKFPKAYFAEDAFQTITISAKYSDPEIKSNIGITFQGDFVMDNNEIIPGNKISTYTQTIPFGTFKKVKLQGFYIESLIFNNTEMIDQEKKYIIAK